MGEVSRGHARSKPPRPNPSDDPSVVSIPTGLAVETRDGLAYTLRRVTPADAGLLDEFLRRLSAKTRWLRFMTARPCSPEVVHAEVARMVAGSTGNAITLIVTEARSGSEAVAAVAELVYTRESGTGESESSLWMMPSGRGSAAMLLQRLLQIAQELGLTHLHGDMFAENDAIRRRIQALQLSYTATIQSGEIHMIIRVPE